MIEKYFEIFNGKQIDRFHVKNIKELPQEAPKVELTLQQIAEKFGLEVNQLRIKDK